MGISGESIRVKTGAENDQAEIAATLLARAREMVPLLAERAAQAEKQRSIPAETIADFKQAGLFRVSSSPSVTAATNSTPASSSTSR
jgi:hypothetical protein